MSPSTRAPRALLGALLLGALLGLLAPALGPARASAQDTAQDPEPAWRTAAHLSLPSDGLPIDLAAHLPAGEGPVRLVLSGTFTFLYDGSQIDAFAAERGGVRDEAAGPFVVLPEGARAAGGDPLAHRYIVELPRAARMPVAFNVLRLANARLITVSEASEQLRGAIELSLLVPPPPPPPEPTAAEAAVSQAEAQVGSVPGWAWASGAIGAPFLLFLGLFFHRKRSRPEARLLRRARRAKETIGAESAALGPAFDPVSAGAARLMESAEATVRHLHEKDAALERTAWAESESARARRAQIAEERRAVFGRLEDLVARLEATATQLAGRSADRAAAQGLDELLGELTNDLDAAVAAEEELGGI